MSDHKTYEPEVPLPWSAGPMFCEIQPGKQRDSLGSITGMVPLIYPNSLNALKEFGWFGFPKYLNDYRKLRSIEK